MSLRAETKVSEFTLKDSNREREIIKCFVQLSRPFTCVVTKETRKCHTV